MKQTLYFKSLKQLWQKETLKYFAIDFGMILGVFAAFLLCLFLYRKAYTEFIQAVPAFTTLSQMIQQNPGLTGVDANLLATPLQTAREATYGLIARVLAAFATFTTLLCVILGAGNSYIWKKIKKSKKNAKEKRSSLKRMGSFTLISLMMQVIWIILTLLTVWIVRSPKLVYFFALYLIAIPYNYTIAYSFTEKGIIKSIKQIFTKPFIKIHHYILAATLTFLTFALATNILFGIMYVVLPKAPFEWLTSLLIVVLVLGMLSWMRYYFLEIQNRHFTD